MTHVGHTFHFLRVNINKNWKWTNLLANSVGKKDKINKKIWKFKSSSKTENGNVKKNRNAQLE